jgi:diguanylate cyclase (GGDEF)-like protein
MPFNGADQTASRWASRVFLSTIVAVLCCLAGFSILTENHVADQAAQVKRASGLSQLYADAWLRVAQEQSLAREYRLGPTQAVLTLHARAGRELTGDLQKLLGANQPAASRPAIAALQRQQTAYTRASASLFRAVDRHDAAQVINHDRAVIKPIIGGMLTVVDAANVSSTQTIGRETDLLRQDTRAATRAIGIAVAVALVLLSLLALIAKGFRRRALVLHTAEIDRLRQAALIDSLTGLRNRRAFHEDLVRDLAWAARTGRPLALSMLDLDGLKTVNDTHGHQAGDERLTALAHTLVRAFSGNDRAYRLGGDEFAVISTGARSWDAVEASQRLQVAMAAQGIGVTAGIAEGACPERIDSIIREADLALIAGKRNHQDITLYSPELELELEPPDGTRDAEHITSLSRALALAVDAKDAYTRSHCQTVSQLCALLATELGFEPRRIEQMRLAGLLHDVGKIGIADAILNKPGALTSAEYDDMKRHSILGEQIVAAGDLPEEARWIRHHHERYDGNGYPSRLAGGDIPLESRIILVADAFEAMTSDRPYRKAPGRAFAIAELRLHAGAQFDPVVVHALCRALEPAPHDPQPGPSDPIDGPPESTSPRLLATSRV